MVEIKEISRINVATLLGRDEETGVKFISSAFSNHNYHTIKFYGLDIVKPERYVFLDKTMRIECYDDLLEKNIYQKYNIEEPILYIWKDTYEGIIKTACKKTGLVYNVEYIV